MNYLESVMGSFTVDENGNITLTDGDDTFVVNTTLKSDGTLYLAPAIYGLAGDDFIVGGRYTGLIDGGDGDDTISASPGVGTRLIGGNGRNLYSGGPYDRPVLNENLIDYRFVHTSRDGGIFIAEDGSGEQVVRGSPGVVEFKDGSLVSFSSLPDLITTSAPVTGDITGDGGSEVLWRNANGATTFWTADTSGFHGSAFENRPLTSWHIVETFDVNGDGRADVLWRNDNGAIAIWSGGKNPVLSGTLVDTSMGNDWQIVATGNFEGRGVSGILWMHNDGALQEWAADGNGGFTNNTWSHASLGTGWHVEGSADFHGVGRDDLVVRNDNGTFKIWNGLSDTVPPGLGFSIYEDSSVGTGWHMEGFADFDGDGRADMLWRHDNGSVSVWAAKGVSSKDLTFTAIYNDSSVGNGWHIAGTGDYNNDGKADILWRHDNGSVSAWTSTGQGFEKAAINGYAPPDWAIGGHDYPL